MSEKDNGISKNVRRAINAWGSTSELSELTGIIEATLNNYMRGGLPSVANAAKIAAAMNISIDKLLLGHDTSQDRAVAAVRQVINTTVHECNDQDVPMKPNAFARIVLNHIDLALKRDGRVDAEEISNVVSVVKDQAG